MLHTTLVLSIVLSFCLLNRNFLPNNPSALSIFNYRSVFFFFYICLISLKFMFVSFSFILPLKQKISSQQSLSSLHLQLPQCFFFFLHCVNCVKIFYRIN